MAGIFKASMATVEDILSGVIVRIGKWGDDKKGAPNLNFKYIFFTIGKLVWYVLLRRIKAGFGLSKFQVDEQLEASLVQW